MFDRRQLELIRNLCMAGLRAPEVGFEIGEELIAIGKTAESKMKSIDADAEKTQHEVAVLAEAVRIKVERDEAAKAVRGQPDQPSEAERPRP